MNRKMKAVLLLSVAVALSVSASAFKMPSASSLTGAGSSSGSSLDVNSVKTKVQNILNTSNATTESFNKSLVVLNTILASKEEVAKLKEAQEAAEGKAKTAAASAFAEPVAAASASNLIAIAGQVDLKDKIQALTKEQKQQTVDAAFNVALANLGFATVATDSADLVKEISSDSGAAVKLSSELKSLKTISSNAVQQIKASADVTGAVTKIIAAGDIKFKAPTSAAEKAKKVSVVW